MDQVLVGVDGSDASRRAVGMAADEARCRGATLTAVLVEEPPLFGRGGDPDGDGLDQRRAELAALVADTAAPGTELQVEQRVETGDPRQVLRKLSVDADHLVIGSRGLGTAAGLLLGSVSQYLVTHAECSVTVARPTSTQDGKLRRVAVGVDGSAVSLEAVEWALDVARCHGAAFSAVIVAPPVRRYDSWQDAFVEGADAGLHATLEAAMASQDVDVERRVRTGDPRQVLQELSASVDLLVVGSRGHGTVAGLLLGSVSQSVVTHAQCPVTVVRSP